MKFLLLLLPVALAQTYTHSTLDMRRRPVEVETRTVDVIPVRDRRIYIKPGCPMPAEDQIRNSEWHRETEPECLRDQTQCDCEYIAKNRDIHGCVIDFFHLCKQRRVKVIRQIMPVGERVVPLTERLVPEREVRERVVPQTQRVVKERVVPGSERVLEKVDPLTGRVVEKIRERVIEKVDPETERVIEKVVERLIEKVDPETGRVIHVRERLIPERHVEQVVPTTHKVVSTETIVDPRVKVRRPLDVRSYIPHISQFNLYNRHLQQ